MNEMKDPCCGDDCQSEREPTLMDSLLRERKRLLERQRYIESELDNNQKAIDLVTASPAAAATYDIIRKGL